MRVFRLLKEDVVVSGKMEEWEGGVEDIGEMKKEGVMRKNEVLGREMEVRNEGVWLEEREKRIEMVWEEVKVVLGKEGKGIIRGERRVVEGGSGVER